MKEWIKGLRAFLEREWVSRVVFLAISLVVLIVVILLVCNSNSNFPVDDYNPASDADWSTIQDGESTTPGPIYSGVPEITPGNTGDLAENPADSSSKVPSIDPDETKKPFVDEADNVPLMPEPDESKVNMEAASPVTEAKAFTTAQKLELRNFATTNVMNSGLSDAESVILSDKDTRGNSVVLPVFISRLQSMLELKGGYDIIVAESGEGDDFKQAWSDFSTEATRLANEAIELLQQENPEDTSEDWLDGLWELYELFILQVDK